MEIKSIPLNISWNSALAHTAEKNQATCPTVYWQSSNTKACGKKLSQILANGTDNGGMGIGLKIYVSYCRCLPDFSAIDVAFANIFKISKVSIERMKKEHLSEFLLGGGQSRIYFPKVSDKNLRF